MPHKKQKNPTQTGQIRIISGQFRGRKLPVIDTEGLRPSTDRTKETLFNWLQGHIRGARCLDAFCGSGSLGFEALSRGAEHVYAWEKNKAAHAQLRANSKLLKTEDQFTATCGDFLAANLSQLMLTSSVDIVFIDPPFQQQLLEKAIKHIQQASITTSDTLWYIEHEVDANIALEALNLHTIKQANTSGFIYGLYQLDA